MGGPVSQNIPIIHQKVTNVYQQNKQQEINHIRDFFKNKLNHYEPGLKKLAKKVSQNGTIQVVNIEDLFGTIQQSADKSRKTSTRVILYGLIKNFPKSVMEDIYLDRESGLQIEDMLPGNYISTVKTLPRIKKFGSEFYDYKGEDTQVWLEDFSNFNDTHFVLLKGEKIKSAGFCTGMPVVIIGRYRPKGDDNEISNFEVEDIHKLNVLADLEIENLPKLKSRKILTISGLKFGAPDMMDSYEELLDNLSDPDSVFSDVTHIFIVGHSVDEIAWKSHIKFSQENPSVPEVEDQVLKINSTVLSRKQFDCKAIGSGQKSNILKLVELRKFIKQLDEFLCSLLEMFPVTIFAGGDDPGYQKPPFTGFDRELFVKAAKYKNFRCTNSNSDAVIKDDNGTACNILALSHKLQIESEEDRLKVILEGLEYATTTPGAPFPEQIDTFYSLPSYLHNVPDPFTLSKCPNIVFTLNNTKKCTKITPKSDNPEASIFVQSVCDF